MDTIRQSLLLAPETDDVVFPYKSRRESEYENSKKQCLGNK